MSGGVLNCLQCEKDFDPYTTGKFAICPDCGYDSYLKSKSREQLDQEEYERFLKAAAAGPCYYPSDGYDGPG
jgi:DNA-directed RNA polymerase subunit RPC12/RpoP